MSSRSGSMLVVLTSTGAVACAVVGIAHHNLAKGRYRVTAVAPVTATGQGTSVLAFVGHDIPFTAIQGSGAPTTPGTAKNQNVTGAMVPMEGAFFSLGHTTDVEIEDPNAPLILGWFDTGPTIVTLTFAFSRVSECRGCGGGGCGT